MLEPKEIFVKIDRCQGCLTCELACAVEHSQSKNLFAALAERPRPRNRLWIEKVEPTHKVPVLCRHCEDAPGMHACIAGAIRRNDDGVVLTDADKCIGCWTCVMVCPFGVIGRHLETHKSYRCDRCPDREAPACVTSCPTGALVYRTAGEFSAATRQGAAAEMAASERG
jgi:carbon-monoxide dehydrogenase iron sulfur subunit